ncbi:MAG TPA: A/G-specific adenine glycosylase [Oleiagrimonas sp.]|nr:A/G-specific adenine glycosylase [Oleiagrimonas sp.]
MIASRLLPWFDRCGRHDLPWQEPRTAYRVWLSEIMLQQTQVATVIPYFRRFMEALPTLSDLAAADEDQVLALWSGLGYYRRARFAHQAARECVEKHGGELPRDFDALCALPGIGRSTAGAILAQAHGLRFAILDGNVKRVLTRYHGIHGHPGQSAVEKKLWQLAEQNTPHQRVADYTQAIMDLGATVCTRANPDCGQCPLSADCVARRDDLTSVLPERKPTKTLPVRHTIMLLLRDVEGRILLEKRDMPGVRAGLWSLPESDAAHAMRDASRLANVGAAQAHDQFTHTFSHYRLEVEPLLFDEATSRPGIADNDRLRWCTRDDMAKLGLPSPVRTLLDTLTTSRSRT